MGKAIVINGLAVANPLMIVNFAKSPEEAAIQDYLQANQTINQTEKDALLVFVKGLIDNNLWGKMKYFYPFLGSTVSDSIKEAISPSTEDLFDGAGTSGLSVSNRVLIANNRIAAYANTGIRAKALDPTKIGFIIAGNGPDVPGGQEFIFRTSNNLGIQIATGCSAYRYPILSAGATEISLSENTQSYANRIVFGNINSGVGSLYADTTLKASGEVDLSSYQIHQTYGVMVNPRTSDYQYNFFAITEDMTDADWGVFYPFILEFLKTIGRHS